MSCRSSLLPWLQISWGPLKLRRCTPESEERHGHAPRKDSTPGCFSFQELGQVTRLSNPAALPRKGKFMLGRQLLPGLPELPS